MLRKTKFNKKAVSLLLCIIAAFGLWVYVSYVENPDMTRWVKNIPVTISGETALNENGFAIREISNAKIDLKLSTKRNTFRNLSASTINAVADVSHISQTGKNTITVSVSFPGTTGVTISDRSRTHITVEVEDFAVQTFSVKPVITQNPPSGYFVNSVRLAEGDMLLSVSGCKSLVEQVHHISTSDVDLSNAVDSVVYPLTFMAVDSDGKVVSGVNISTPNASVTFEIHKEAPLSLAVNLTGDDPDITYRLTPPAIYVSGPVSLIDSLEPLVVANINEYSYNAGDTVTVNVTIPEGTTLRDKDPAQVDIQFTEQ